MTKFTDERNLSEQLSHSHKLRSLEFHRTLQSAVQRFSSLFKTHNPQNTFRR
jgi:hypothetical protein